MKTEIKEQIVELLGKLDTKEEFKKRLDARIKARVLDSLDNYADTIEFSLDTSELEEKFMNYIFARGRYDITLDEIADIYNILRDISAKVRQYRKDLDLLEEGSINEKQIL